MKAVGDELEVICGIYDVNLGVKEDERVLVFTDLIRAEEKIDRDERKKREELREIAKEVAVEGENHCLASYMEFPSVMGHGKEPPVELWDAAYGKKAVAELKKNGVFGRILNKEAESEDLKRAEAIIREYALCPNAIIALSNYSTSHTRFRDYLTRVKGVRYASMPLFEKSMLHCSMTADWKEVEARTLRLVELMRDGQTVFITSHNGTSITFSMKGREPKPDTGIITKPGSFSNLPAGEAFLAPVEGTAEGTLVLEWAPTRKLKKPVSLTVKNGRVVEASGEAEFSQDLMEKIGLNPLIGNIAELGIGTNDKAERPDNILETEKILGTVHIALGDNSSFGGKVSVPFHQDFIFYRPSLEVLDSNGDKIEILIEGDPRF